MDEGDVNRVDRGNDGIEQAVAIGRASGDEAQDDRGRAMVKANLTPSQMTPASLLAKPFDDPCANEAGPMKSEKEDQQVPGISGRPRNPKKNRSA